MTCNRDRAGDEIEIPFLLPTRYDVQNQLLHLVFRILRADDAREAPGGAQLLQTFYPLHVGAVGGWLVKWLYVILGLAPAILSVTGTIIWYRRWRRTDVEDSPDPDEIDTRAVQVPPRLKTIADANGAQRESPYVEPH